ncbi:helix-turn-helix domain-containing protein [Oscillibacter sp.]|uniref:TetR/AcrR family transcriptional regulator n=1 Tax=Oscillibacter sp. TaxID=1945593 RepID=UPI002896881E|nr:helix-turn-helix domain-containing protein [Oscillibacter sp.]
MARKNNPTQTVESIISVSAKLFIEKGYDKTSMQDIVAALGMSKGAIFHHFKSKEDIFNEVINRQFQYVEQTLYQWIDEMQELTAKEKLIKILEKNLNDQQAHSLDSVLSTQIQNPYFIVATMQEGVNKSAPIFAKIMREGKEDGSITTQFPDECAEIFFLLMNIWCDPVIFACDLSRLMGRLNFLQQILIKMGADIITDELIASYLKFVEKLYEREKI